MNRAFPLQVGRGDEAKGGGSGPDSRAPKPSIVKPRDMYTPDHHIDTLKIQARNFGEFDPGEPEASEGPLSEVQGSALDVTTVGCINWKHAD
ncbi:hypothetical protein [Bradyrhizobium sp. WSM3983]|uniref:hypothetical protein n=1 Tax=Bradyrhizobium sp. WSM3983 TaxID=1038867 RepID=UPI0003FD36A6|nr:hypothetical protein [Bradyrhizobium sp. WSM3983]